MSIVRGMPFEDYLAAPMASNSVLKIIAENEFPALARQALDNRKDTEELNFGRLLHCAWVEPDRFDRDAVMLPEDAPKRLTSAQVKSLTGKKPNPDTVAAAAWWERWDADTAGKMVIDRDDYEVIRRMVDSVNSHPVVREFLQEPTEFEVSAFSEVSGAPVKCRADAKNSRIGDLKSTDGITTAWLERTIDQRRYHMQHAMYLDIFDSLGAGADDFLFFFVDKNPPHITRVIRLPDAAVEFGRREYLRALSLYQDCTLFEYWPGPPALIESVGLPKYIMKRLENDYA